MAQGADEQALPVMRIQGKQKAEARNLCAPSKLNDMYIFGNARKIWIGSIQHIHSYHFQFA